MANAFRLAAELGLTLYPWLPCCSRNWLTRSRLTELAAHAHEADICLHFFVYVFFLALTPVALGRRGVMYIVWGLHGWGAARSEVPLMG